MEGARETWGAPFFRTFLSPLKSLKDSGKLFPSQQQGDKPPKRKEQRDEVGGPRGEERVQDAALPKRRTEVYTAKYRNVHSSATVTAI